MPRPVAKNEPETEVQTATEESSPDTTEQAASLTPDQVREAVRAELASIQALYDRQNSLREEADGIDDEISEAVARLKVHGNTFKSSATGTVHMIRAMSKSGKLTITGFRESGPRKEPTAIEF